MNLVDQRCSNHVLREAAVQCPSCKRFFCRECVTEHQGRMICVGCVTIRDPDRPRARLKAGWTVAAAGGIVLAWLLFYYLGLTLARIPSEFHAAQPPVPGRDHRERSAPEVFTHPLTHGTARCSCGFSTGAIT